MNKWIRYLAVLLFAGTAYAQNASDVTGLVSPPGGGTNSVTPNSVTPFTNKTISGPTNAITIPFYSFTTPTVVDTVPIIQGAQMGYTQSGFNGQYYSDPVLYWGYNYCSANGIVAPCLSSSDPWAQGIDNENDYNVSSGSSYTSQSGTTTTIANFSGTPTFNGTGWVANQFAKWVLCDGGASAANCGVNGTGSKGSSLITANTSGATPTITVSPAIAGMASGDVLVLMYRQAEFRLGASFASSRWTAFGFNVDKGTSLAKSALYLNNSSIAVPTTNCSGVEFLPDYLVNVSGSGTNDLLTVSYCGAGVGLTLKRFNSLDPTFSIQGGNATIALQGAQNNGQNWVTAANGHRGDMVFSCYDGSGSGKRCQEWDPQGLSWLAGDTTLAFKYVFQGINGSSLAANAYVASSAGRAFNTGTTADTVAASVASTFESANTGSGAFTVTLAAPTGDGERRRVCFKNLTGTITWTVTSPATATSGLPTTIAAGSCAELVYNSVSGTPAGSPATTWLLY